MGVFAVACLAIMWTTTGAATWAAERNRRVHGIEWRRSTWGLLAAAFYVTALDAWVWL